MRPEVLELARNFRCEVCEERSRVQPRKMASLEDIPPKWSRMQSDVGSWQHPDTGEVWKFILAIDEGSRLRVGQMIGSGSHRHASGQEFIDFYNTFWRPCFGKPATIRLDPDGAWRSRMLDEYFSREKVMIEHVPTEAHWQISLIERSIQTTQGMMQALASEFPNMQVGELFARTLWAQNTHDQYLGFTPLQHAFGRSPGKDGELHSEEFQDFPILTERGLSAEFGDDVKAMASAEKAFIDAQASQRLQRAARSGGRALRQFYPGDLVFYWRKQVTKNHGASRFGSGRYLWPARVLATETRRDESGECRPGSVVWLYRAGRLLKAAPEQLRPASAREEAWQELKDDRPIPWTINGVLESSQRKVYDDIQQGWTEAELEAMDEDEEEVQPAPLKRLRTKQPLQEVRAAEEMRSVEEQHILSLAQEGVNEFLNQPGACAEVAIDLPHGKDAKKKGWLRDFEAYVVNQVKKNHVEVSERSMTPEEITLFKAAKDKEVKNFISAQVFERLPERMRPDRNQALRMRWILTWKVDPLTGARKAKARAVVLGFLDPEYEFRPTASPTMTRSTRQIFLTMCAAYGFRVKKGDVSGAFLQGREYTRHLLCEPLPEILEALGLPPKTLTRLKRAAYGLVEAPIEWYLTVASFLESIGFERQRSDPCCFGLFDKENQPIGWICCHVDDFLFGGADSDPRWQKVCSQIQERFKWTEWETDKFVQCGLTVEQTPTGFLLSQPDYLDNVEEIHLSKKRFEEKELPVTEEER